MSSLLIWRRVLKFLVIPIVVNGIFPILLNPSMETCSLLTLLMQSENNLITSLNNFSIKLMANCSSSITIGCGTSFRVSFHLKWVYLWTKINMDLTKWKTWLDSKCNGVVVYDAFTFQTPLPIAIQTYTLD